MCQERTDMYSVKETAREIICPTECDEMNVKRFVRYLKGAPNAKCQIEIVTPPEVREHVHNQRLGKSTNDMQKCKWRSCSFGKQNFHSMVMNTAKQCLSSSEAELHALTTGVAEGMVTKHLLQELGHEVTHGSCRQ